MEETCMDYSQAEQINTIELPPKEQVPFLQSSQTVRRCDSSVDLPTGEPTDRSNVSLEIDKLLASQDHRKHTNDEDDRDRMVLSQGREQPHLRATDSLPTLEELMKRSRKRSSKPRRVLSRNAVAVEEHVTQLQRKNSQFFGGPIHESPLQPYVPHETTVHVTRDQLQQVPSSAEIIQHPSLTPLLWPDDTPAEARPHPNMSPSFWSANDWLSGPSSSTDRTTMDQLATNSHFEDKSLFMGTTPDGFFQGNDGRPVQEETARDLYFFSPDMVSLEKYPEE